LCGNKYAFVYIFIYYIYYCCEIVSWIGEGEYPGKLLSRNRYTNGFSKIWEEFPAMEGEFQAGYRYIDRFPKTLEEFLAGEGEYLGKLRDGKQGHQQSHKYLRRIPGWGKIIVPTS
jgi:hypothetical protein